MWLWFAHPGCLWAEEIARAICQGLLETLILRILTFLFVLHFVKLVPTAIHKTKLFARILSLGCSKNLP
jgi:hypothetical protein